MANHKQAKQYNNPAPAPETPPVTGPDTWLLEICCTKAPFMTKEIIAGDEADCVARVEELFCRGLRVAEGKYTAYNGPALIEQVRYRKA